MKSVFCVAAFFTFLLIAALAGQCAAAPAVPAPTTGVPADSTITVWVFLKDKCPSGDTWASISDLRSRFSPRALARRAKVRTEPLVDWRDLPVCGEYVQSLRGLGFRVRAISKWLNAVSVKCRESDRPLISALPFVNKTRRVASFRANDMNFERIEEMPRPAEIRPASQTPLSGATPAPPVPEAQGDFLSAAPGDTSFYGPAWKQLNIIQIPSLHAQGYAGQGMFIGVLDTGFNLKHQALKNTKVVAQWDFINWDSVTANQPAQDSFDQDSHGTMILGEIGGYKAGVYVGAAYGAEFALAKTEYVPTETPIEEDYWVMGLEWLDSLGVDLVTSSLGYIDWYTYQDMDGNTAVTTVAADMAVANGLSIFSAMGNGGISSYVHMIAPADGDSVMSIGAVDSLGVLWPQSSRGPTYDGRIKPDVVAMGKSVYVVYPYDTTSYWRVSGTSCSTPLAAGAGALILQKNPAWNPMKLRDAMRSTATNAASPDTAIGWGIVRAQLASDYEIISVADGRTPPPGARVRINITNIPNPFNPVTAIRVNVDSPASFDRTSSHRTGSESPSSDDAAAASVFSATSGFTAGIFDVSGRHVKDFGRLRFEANSSTVLWDGRDDSGRTLPSGVYLFRVMGVGNGGMTASQTRKLVLLK